MLLNQRLHAATAYPAPMSSNVILKEKQNASGKNAIEGLVREDIRD